MNRYTTLLAALAASLLAGACSLSPAPRQPISTWDFGPAKPVAAARLGGTLLVLPVEAPVWLDSPSMLYRLTYADGAEPRVYANSRWIASPPSLLTERLRAALAASGTAVLTPGDGIRGGRTLRVELEQFDQVFDSPSASQAALRLRATLISSGRLTAQRSFRISVPASGNDARGGALALAEAVNRGVGELIAWLATTAPRD